MEKCTSNDQAWFCAIERGHDKFIRKNFGCISHIDVRGVYTLGNVEHANVTGLIIAAHFGHKEVVRWLLKCKADVNAETDLGWRPVHFACKNGHVATLEILHDNGAYLDVHTSDNESPLTLALKSNMRDTVQKLVSFGVPVPSSHQSIIRQYVYRGIVPRSMKNSVTRGKRFWQRNPATRFASPTSHQASIDKYLPPTEPFRMVELVNLTDACRQTTVNQLQCLSTDYDLELARRKRELVRKMHTSRYSDLIACMAPADVSTENRLMMTSALLEFLQQEAFADGEQEDLLLSVRRDIYKKGESYLRLIEACLCESHCPPVLARELSHLSLAFAFSDDSMLESKGTNSNESLSSVYPAALSIASYINRLLHKLLSNTNSQFRSGILAHLIRIFSEEPRAWMLNVRNGHSKRNIEFWSELFSASSSLLELLVRLGESLEQPATISRFACLVGVIGQRLLECNIDLDPFTPQFTELADILVGLCVDTTSMTKGLCLQNIYSVMSDNLAGWWLVPPARPSIDKSESKSVTQPVVNASIIEMLYHLLEDSENAMNAVLTGCFITNSNRTIQPTVSEVSRDTAQSPIHIRLYTSMLAEIIEGVATRQPLRSHCNLEAALGLNDSDVHKWVDRLLRLAKAAHTCHRAVHSGGSEVGWHNARGGNAAPLPRTPYSVVDGIEQSIFKLLAYFVATPHGSDMCQYLEVYVTNRLSDSAHVAISSMTLKNLLHLICSLMMKFSSRASAHPILGDALLAYFSAPSILNCFKLSIRTSRNEPPLSTLVYNALCSLCSDANLRGAVCRLSWVDFRVAISLVDNKVGEQSLMDSNCEILGTFSLSLLSSALMSMTPEEKVNCYKRTVEVLISECSTSWERIPIRLRLSILAFFNTTENALIANAQLPNLSVFISGLLAVRSTSPLEHLLALKAIGKILSSVQTSHYTRRRIFIDLVALARHILHYSDQEMTGSSDNFSQCVRILIAHCLVGAEVKDDNTLYPSLFSLSELACSHACKRINSSGSDLYLALAALGRPEISTPQLSVQPFRAQFTWYASRQPEASTTSLLSPANKAHRRSVSDGTNLTVSSSAYPSLPAIAGLLGILTRGAPYSLKTETSRLKLLREPQDWLHRLSQLISPIPSDMRTPSMSHPGDSVASVLWYAAWSMVDYKLKVAPWAKPLCTFLSIEGCLRALLKSYSNRPDRAAQTMPTQNFYQASSEALSCQSCSRQLWQSHVLTLFIQFLERTIHNAIAGFAVTLPRPPVPACTFFSANVLSCTQWFNRVRSLMLRVADGWPVVLPRSASLETSAVTVYNSYALLDVTDLQQSGGFFNWCSRLLAQQVAPEELIVRLSKALLRLSAWEDLQALTDWIDGFKLPGEVNPFGWLSGVTALARGRWDEAIVSLQQYTDAVLRLLSRGETSLSDLVNCGPTKEDEDDVDSGRSSPVEYASIHRAGLAYASSLLLQYHLNVGDLAAYDSRLQSSLEVSEASAGAPPLQSTWSSAASTLGHLSLSSARMQCFRRLATWSTEQTSNVKSQRGEQRGESLGDASSDDVISRWSYSGMLSRLNDLLYDSAILATPGNRGTAEDITDAQLLKVGRLVKIIRSISKPGITTCSMTLGFPLVYFTSTDLAESNECLTTWLRQAGQLIDFPRSKSCAVYRQSVWSRDFQPNSVCQATWQHLISLSQPLLDVDTRNLRLNAILRACCWACHHDSPRVACQLLTRELKHELERFEIGGQQKLEDPLKRLYQVLSKMLDSGSSSSCNLSCLQSLLLSRCVSQTLWLSSNACTGDTGSSWLKLAAIDLLSLGLRHILTLDRVETDTSYHPSTEELAQRCDLSAACALQLFDWLEMRPAGADSPSWVDSIGQLQQRSAGGVVDLKRIARNLSFFSQLVDVPWCHGLPVGTPAPSKSDHGSSSGGGVYQSWTSRLLMMSTRLSLTGSSSLAWLRMADWCYARGQALVDETQTRAQLLLSRVVTPEEGLGSGVPARPCPLLGMLQPDEQQSLSTAVHQLYPEVAVVASDHREDDLATCRLLAALSTFLVCEGHQQQPQPIVDSTEATVSSASVSSGNGGVGRCQPKLRLSSLCPDETTDLTLIYARLDEHVRSVLSPGLGMIEGPLPGELLSRLHNLVQLLVHRRYSLHTSAAQAYATYLSVAEHQSALKSTGSRSTGGASTASPSRLDTFNATLKLLDLLSAPSRALRDLIAGFLMQGCPTATASTVLQSPNRPHHQQITTATLGGPSIWEACLSQVVVRLNLPDRSIRQCLISLLSRLIMTGRGGGGGGNDGTAVTSSSRFAARLVFPAVVAATSSGAAEEEVATVITSSRPSTADRQRPSSAAVASRATPALLDDTSSSGTRGRANKTTATGEISVNQGFGRQLLAALHAAGFTCMVHQVETFVRELQRLTLLWEELWLGTLTQHLDELAKKMHLLDADLKRPLPTTTTPTSTLGVNGARQTNARRDTLPQQIAADRQQFRRGVQTSSPSPVESETTAVGQLLTSVRLAAAVQPTLAVLDQLINLTLAVTPQTPHEQWFQKTFGPVIGELREAFVATTDTESPLLLMRQFIHRLQSVHTTMEPSSRLPEQQSRQQHVENKPPASSQHQVPQNSAVVAPVTAKPPVYMLGSSTGGVLHLSLNHLSPRLARMHFGTVSGVGNAGIPLPGRTDLQSATLVNRVAILPTKTRPKRLVFHAQDGHTYSYLLKGLEDLRLDDRIMRLYELITSAATVDSGSESYQPFARTYAVTPLGVRAGLLQMVQGAVPLFYLYKRWQLRMAADANKAAGMGTTPSGTTSVPRPGELFHSRLKEVMQTNGHDYQTQAPRSSWPMPVLRQVFTSLEADTPGDLLSRELWAANPTSASWWQATQMFSRSAGLMSALGYLVGLGDRHLDNLLVDMVTGHLIHIDYNVCFDKGRALRVAERVPFRLTRIIRRALGPLAQQDSLVRGGFRVTAENTLRTARNILDPILIQMNAFLIDPLVDWQLQSQRTQQAGSAIHHQSLVPDLIHLSAYSGGGSSDCPRYRGQRLHRITAELHLYASLVATRLVELVASSELGTVQNCLDDMVAILSAWTERRRADQLVAEWNAHLALISAATRDDNLDAAQVLCNRLETAEEHCLQLQRSLISELSDWRQQFIFHQDLFSHLADPLWLPSRLAGQSVSVRKLITSLTRYTSIARIYLTHPNVSASRLTGNNQFEQLHRHLDELLRTDSSPLLNQETLATCHKLLSDGCESELIISDQVLQSLRPATAMSHASVSSLRDALTELTNNGVQGETPGQAIQPELDNLRLFLYDQRSFGLSSYCWALLDHLPNFIGDALALETEPKCWEFRDDDDDAFAVAMTGGYYSGCEVVGSLTSLTFMAECLVNLFSVLQNQSLGAFHFTAGYEADVRREVAFMLAVRDAIHCVNQLHSNLIRLLLPQATEAVVMNPDGDLISSFSNLLVHHMAESDASCLKDFVDNFLMRDCVGELTENDAALRQVLIAIHLALLNTTAQMEEIAHRMKQCSITAASWYYVDIVAQPAQTLLNRSFGWRAGATNLWGWTAAPALVATSRTSVVGQDFTGHHPATVTSTSWLDEVYANGLMAFISVLEEVRASWLALFPSVPPSATTSDYSLAPFSTSLLRFASRLVSRIALPSLLALSAGRLFCCLIEDSGNSISRILIECRAAGSLVVDTVTEAPVPIVLSAEKLIEAAEHRLTFSQPVEVQQLRSPARTLISRMTSRASLAGERVQKTIELEAAERHSQRLSIHLTAIQWVRGGDSNNAVLLPSLVETLASLQRDLEELEASEDGRRQCSDDHDQLVVSLSRAIIFVEGLRLKTSESCARRAGLLDLVERLQTALVDRQTASASMTNLATALTALKCRYNLTWPASSWPTSPVCSEQGSQPPDGGGGEPVHRNLPDQLQHELALAKKRAVAAQRQIGQSKRKLLLLMAGDSSSTGGGQDSNRAAAKRSSGRSTSSAVMSSHSQRLNNLRGSLTTLQCGRLTELRQLIKVIIRLHAMRLQLIDTGVSVGHRDFLEESGQWRLWLADHQTWTGDVLHVLNQVNRLIQLLGGGGGGANSRPTEDQSGEASELAIRLHRDCLHLCQCLWARLVSPLVHIVQDTVSGHPQLAGPVETLLTSLMSAKIGSAMEQVGRRLAALEGEEELEGLLVKRQENSPSEHQESRVRESVINSQALAVWQRLRDRCLGIDPHLSAFVVRPGPEDTQVDDPLPVPLHVDACIRAATDLDNLALMYEGWTAWV